MRAVVAAADLVPAVRPTRVGIDETVMTTGRLTRRRRQFLTALVCLDSGLVEGVVTGRGRASAVRLLTAHAPDVQVIAFRRASLGKFGERHHRLTARTKLRSLTQSALDLF